MNEHLHEGPFMRPYGTCWECQTIRAMVAESKSAKAEAELGRARAELDDLWEWVEMNRNRQMKETRALSNRHAEKRLRPPTKTRTGEG